MFKHFEEVGSTPEEWIDSGGVGSRTSTPQRAALNERSHQITSDATMGSTQWIFIENGLCLDEDDPQRRGAKAAGLC